MVDGVPTLIKHDASTLIKHDEILSLIKLDASHTIMVDASNMIYHGREEMHENAYRCGSFCRIMCVLLFSCLNDG